MKKKGLKMKAIIINGGNSLSSRVVGVEQEIGKLLTQENITYESIYYNTQLY